MSIFAPNSPFIDPAEELPANVEPELIWIRPPFLIHTPKPLFDAVEVTFAPDWIRSELLWSIFIDSLFVEEITEVPFTSEKEPLDANIQLSVVDEMVDEFNLRFYMKLSSMPLPLLSEIVELFTVRFVL